jgi:death-on-curing protein
VGAEPVWLDRRIVEALHEQLIQEYGGTAGIRDAGLLESALGRPRNKWGYEEDFDLSLLAASYAYGLARNHPFVDGNKRIAATAVGVFLGLNGLELEAPEPELVSAILAITTAEWTEDELAAWIRDHTIPLANDNE